MVAIRIPLCCADVCVCFDEWHKMPILIGARDPLTKSRDIPCGEYWDEGPRTFSPAPKVSPWATLDGRTDADDDAQLRAVQRKARNIERKKLPRATFVVADAYYHQLVLPFKSIREESAEEVDFDEGSAWDRARHRLHCEYIARLSRQSAAIEIREGKPQTIKICGVDCPPIRGNWKMYIRRVDESVQDWRRRVKSMVNAKIEGKKIKYEQVWSSWTIEQQISWLSHRLKNKGRFSCLPVDEKEQIAYYLFQQPKSLSQQERTILTPRVKNMGPAIYADQMLMKKMRYARLESDRLELVARQRLRRAAVVLSDPKTHIVCSLKAALNRKLAEYAKQQMQEEIIEPQPWGEMDDSKTAAGVDVEPISDQRSTVILEEQASSSNAQSAPLVKPKNEYACLAAPSQNRTIKDYSDRWITIHQGTWSNENFGQRLFSLQLPRDLLKSAAFKNSPNYMPWRNHVYWHGTQIARVDLNANARQHAQLQVSWYPLNSLDANYDALRTNVFIISQRSHVIINAMSSNIGELTIPFQFYNPNMCVAKCANNWDEDNPIIKEEHFANLGVLEGYVLSPIVANENTPKTITYSVLIAMPEPMFDGLIDASLVEGQMFPLASMMLIREAMDHLDPNRDNPTLSATGMPVIPVNSGSWCIGNGMPEWTNVLRLNPNSSLPYQEGRIPPIDEMKIDHLKSIYGLIKTIHWTAQQGAGTLLWRMDAAPLLPLSDYPVVPVSVANKEYQSYCIPPVGVLSSLFSWWRGELKLRIDIVGAIELTGRLMVAYVPRCYKDITKDQAFNCPHTIFDLQTTNRQFNFSIPYVADRLFWNRDRILLDEFMSYPSPGTVYFFVYNPLIANSSIPSDCNLLIYIAGGKDFEVSVPSFPIFGTAFFPDVAIDSKSVHQLIPRSGYSPVYTDSWRYFNFASRAYMPILRYGNISDHVAQFSTQDNLSNILYLALKTKIGDSPEIAKRQYQIQISGRCYTAAKSDIGSFKATLNCVARHYVGFLDEVGYCYVTVLPDCGGERSKAAVVKAITDQITIPSKKIYKNFRINKSSMSNLVLNCYNDLIFNSKRQFPVQYPNGTAYISIDTFSTYAKGDFYTPAEFILIPEIAAQAGDQKSLAETTPSRPQATACGKQIGGITAYGEQFLDLKDLCRRYQLYARDIVSLGKQAAAERVIVVKFPVLPQGLEIVSSKDNKVNHYWNKTRDGPIGIIASGFRFFCGSIRYKVALDINHLTYSNFNNAIAKVFVQHRPDVIMTTARCSSRSESILGTDDIELPGYATYYQFDNINNVISFEIPFYKPCIRTLAQRPVDDPIAMEFSSLGEVAIGLTLTTPGIEAQMVYEVYYKLGDDARFSDFIGFPPMVDLTRIPPVDVVDTKGFEVIEENDLEAEMGLWDWSPFKTVSNVSDAADKISQIDVEKLNETISESSSFITTLKDNVRNCVPTFDSIKSKLDKYLSTIINLVTNFVHCLLNLNIKSIVTAICSIFTQIKLVSFKCADKLIDALFNLFKQEHPEAPEELKEVAKELTGESDESFVNVDQLVNDNNNHRAAYLSTLIAGIAATLALGPRLCGSDFKSCSMLLFDGIRKFAMTANTLFTFIKNNLIVMQRIGNILVNNSPKIKDIAFLEKEQAEIYAWACEVIDLTDPWKEMELFTNMAKASRVYTLSASGALILLKMSSIKLNLVQTSTINKLRDNIDNLRNRLARAHMAPPVRFVPWIYEITGPTGTGKSEMLNDIPFKLLNHLNLKFKGEIIYHRALGNAYWNNCRNQPVCSIDEKFPISKQGFDDVQIAELFQLKSRCIFNPPMADIPDKNLRYNPLIVQYASNNPYPQLAGILDPQAISRRRDMLIIATWKPAVLRMRNCPKPLTIDRLPYEWRRNWKALDFYIKKDVINEYCQDAEGPMSYDELVSKMCVRWEDYYSKEYKAFQLHLHRALSLYPDGDQEFSTFEDKWKEMIELEDPTIRVRDFRDQYRNIIDLHRKKEISEPIREAKIIKLLKLANGESEANISDEKLMERIKEARVNLKKPVEIATPKVAEEILANTVKGESADKTVVSELEILDSIHKASWKQYNCPHDLLIRFSELNREIFKYNRENNIWTASQLILEEVLRLINDNRSKAERLLLEEFGYCDNEEPVENSKTCNETPLKIQFNENQGLFYISSIPCSHPDCKFKEAYNRQKFYRSYISNNPIMCARLINGSIDQLMSELPDEYAETLSRKVEESRKELNKAKEEVSFFKNLYNTLKEKLMSIDWKKWFSKLALVLGVFFFIGTIMKLWGAFTSPADDVCQQIDENLRATCDGQVGMAGLNTCIAGISLAGVASRDQIYKASTLGEGFPSGDNRAGRTQKKTPVSIARRHISLMSPQAQISEQLSSAVQNKIRRNTFFLQISDPAGEIVYGRALGICGQYALIVDHIWESFTNFKKHRAICNFEFVSAAVPKSASISISMDQCSYTKFTDSALGLLKLPIRLGCFEDLRNFILPETRHMYVNGDGMMLELTGDKNGHVINYSHMVKFSLDTKLTVSGGKLYSNFTTGDTYRYPTFHGKGRCGSTLLALDQQAPICGIHIAGNGCSGFSESIYREMFSNLSNIVSKSSVTFGESVDVAKQKWFVDGQVKGLGIVPTRLASRSSTKSRIIPSEVQESDQSPFPVLTDVSVINPKDPRIQNSPFSPMLEGVKHHGKPLKSFNQLDLIEAIDDYQNLILAKCVPQRPNVGILDPLTVINGIEGKDLYDHIEWNSSEGFPFTSFRPAGSHDKKWMFQFDDNDVCQGYNRMLEQAMEKKWKQRLNNEIPETVFVDCLKDCRIKKEKVLEPGKTRIFSISPVDFTIQQRQCTLDFVTAFMANRLDLEHAIGIDVNSREWTELAQKLLGTGDSILTGDYSKFGDTIPVEFVHAAFKIIANWYKKFGILTWEHEQQLKIMGYEVANSTHLMFNFLYQVVCGQPSGNSLTVIINSIANSLYIRLAWLHIMRDTEYCSLSDLHRLVRWFSYGDDIIAALAEVIKNLFNAQTLCDFFSKFDLKFTNANKGEEMVPYTNLAEAEFLKCGFSPHPLLTNPQILLAPLDISSCKETVNWINSDYLDKRLMSIQVCEDALRNSFGRGPEFYTQFRQQLIDFWQTKNVHFKADTWLQLNFKIFDLGMLVNPFMKKLFVKNPPI